MRIEPIKFCWIELGEGKVCERLAGHDGECSPDPTVDFPLNAAGVRLRLDAMGVHPTSPTYDPAGLSDFIGAAEQPAWTCPHCKRTSWNPNDVKYHYCGACHHFCDEVEPW